MLIKVKCNCPSQERNKPKKVYVIRRTDGGFGMPNLFFTLEAAMKHVNQDLEFWEYIKKSQPNRDWHKEHYLVECEIVERKVIL